jgi:hypothetical protein
MGELAVPVVLLFSLGHQPVAHLLISFARQGEPNQVGCGVCVHAFRNKSVLRSGY